MYTLIGAGLALLLVVALSTIWFYRHLGDNLTVIDIGNQVTNTPKKIAPGDPINVLIMGSDSREGEQTIEQMLDGGARSDTTILLHLSSDRKHAYGVSIPRDTLVDRPDCMLPNGDTIPGEDGAMFNDGVLLRRARLHGADQSRRSPGSRSITRGAQLPRLLEAMVNAIGGVEVCVPERSTTDGTASTSTPAPGGERPRCSRLRPGAARDRRRVGPRPDEAPAGVLRVVVPARSLRGHPDPRRRLMKFLNAATKSLALDEGLGRLLKLARLGNNFRDIGLDHIQFLTVPWQYAVSDPNRVEFKQPEADKLWRFVREDKKLTKGLTEDSVSAAETPGSSPSASPSGTPSSTPTKTPTSSPSTKTPEEIAEEAERNGLCA